MNFELIAGNLFTKRFDIFLKTAHIRNGKGLLFF
jgi:hypothetical protein